MFEDAQTVLGFRQTLMEVCSPAGLEPELSTPAWAIDATILELKRRGVACPETSSWDEDMCTAGEMMALGRGLFGRVAPARAGAAVGAAARDNTRVRIT